jgi:glycosyltransferase involved in cell wall biosynthesis
MLDLGIADDVDLVPATANPFPLMAAAGALALPSLWEGSSNVLLEAMACGTPVVASRTAGDSEHVVNGGKYGLLVDPFDVEGLAAALLRQTGPDRIEPGDRIQAFSRDRAMTRYIQLFDEAVGGTALRAPSLVSL